MRDIPFSLKLYRWLLRLYPPGFREDYSALMEREFRDELSQSRGVCASARFWLRLMADLAMSIPVQLSREVAQDLRYTLRLWLNRPWQAGFAIAALAIGIGANTGVFSVVNALLLRSLPFREPERLAQLHQFIPPHDTAEQFHDWRQQSTYLADAALFEEIDANLGGGRVGSRAHVAQTSGNFFSLLGVHPALGRTFGPEDDVDGTGWGSPGSNAAAVIGYGLWQQLFGGDPRALGSTIRADGNPLTIIGVAPPEFDYPNKAVLWKPAAFSSGNNGWGTVVRLKPGISWPKARAAFAVESESLVPKPAANDSSSLRPSMTSLQDGLAGPVRDASLLFMGAVVLVLLIACTNVANLLMARTADRAGELSIRSALGASRARLARQLLTECLLLSFAATLAGLLIAYWTTSLAAKVEPPPLVAQSYSILDGRVLAFTLTVSLVTALLSGILPLLYLRRVQRFPARSSSQTRNSRLLREGLACAQVMLTMILLAGSVSVGRAFLHLMRVNRGYDVRGVVTVGVSLEGTTHQLGKRQFPYFEEVLDRIRNLPGVRTASATEFLPLYASGFVGGPFGLDGRPATRSSTMVPILSGYFQTMGGQILYGREFTEAEVRSGAPVAVVNEHFAAGFGVPEAALGHQLTNGSDAWKIVGVVNGMEYETDPTTAHGNQVFVPSTAPGSFSSTFVARVNGRAEDHLAAIRDAVQSVDPQVPVFSAKTMEQRLDEIFAAPKFYRTAIWVFAGFALLLALIGIYGIVSYAVVQRTQEMGVRMALGRTPVQLRGMLLRHGLRMVAAGAIPGIVGARFTGRLLETLIEGAKSIDMITSAGLFLFVALVASTSIWSGTRRIARLDVTAILRSE
ncbi:MAG TPA: ABC transporter permease [Terriglobales bacterium]|nr:ABC transporter permease [Terriglobales bacterium]